MAGAWLAGCQGTAPTAPDAAPSAPAPGPASGASAVHYRVLAQDSEIVVRVYRGGSLARLGHNHVIATRDIDGSLWLDPQTGRASVALGFEKTSLLVDDPALRAANGEDFATDVPADAIAATRDNMLGPRLLDAERYPRIEIRSIETVGTAPGITVQATVQVTDQAFPVTFDTDVEIEDRRITASGEQRLSHAELGLEPFSVMLGALRVQDVMELKYSIVAEQSD
jgi:polyisoprenoid-binding protein YceI